MDIDTSSNFKKKEILIEEEITIAKKSVKKQIKLNEFLFLNDQKNLLTEVFVLPDSSSLEVILPFSESWLENCGKILYSLYNKLGYLFSYLDYEIKIQNLPKEITKDMLFQYLNFLFLNPFLTKNEESFRWIYEQWKSPEQIELQNNILQIPPIDEKNLPSLRSNILAFKKILNSWGLNKISLTSSQIKKKYPLSQVIKKKEDLNQKKENNIIDEKSLSSSFFQESKKNEVNNEKKRPLSKEILAEWKNRKLTELSIHTKFSALDGISSPSEYIKAALEKNYQTLAITDHYNVQSFPEFWQHRDPNLKIIYGCEMEMLEDEFPPYIFNHSLQQVEKFWQRPLESLTYCVLDLETTGFFSEHNEIIEIGYVIYKNGKILEEEKKEYLLHPKHPISKELLSAWYTDIDPQELQKSPLLEKIFPLIKNHWEKQGVEILVAHNAKNFDFSFLNKAWKKCFGKELSYPIVDTLPLSRLLLPEKKSHSLEKLSQLLGKSKIKQSHRALADSELLTELLIKLIEILKEEKSIDQWSKVSELLKNDVLFLNRGHRVKVLVKNQEGLNNLYHLITLSHTKNFFRNPRIFRSELVKYRKNLLLGACGTKEGEIFSLFSSFNSENERQEKIKFYDYVEVNAPDTFRHLWLNGQIGEIELKKILATIIQTTKLLNIPAISSHSVHYCYSEQKLIKEIIVANEGMNGSRHHLYNYATLDGKEDRFKNLPDEHLRNQEEIIKDWNFLKDAETLEEIIFINPQKITKEITEIIISDEKIKYPIFSQAQQELEQAFRTKAQEIFSDNIPLEVQTRITKEWEIIQKNYLSIYWLAYKIVQKTHQDKKIVGSRGSVGCSFIAYLCQITDLNPLPPYKFCHKCKYFEFYSPKNRTFSCYDYEEVSNCPHCYSALKMEGHGLPIETFFGWSGEKTPDIDLNFSGDYQKTVHDYVRELVGKKYVHRIGTINKLSQQTAEIFLREYKKLRKSLNPQFNPYANNEEWIIEQLKGIKRTTGQHPGGLLVIPQKIDIYDYTPLHYPADNLEAEWLTTHFEYSFLAKLFLKLDVLGHDEPTVLQKLFELTKKNPTTIEFSDPKVMNTFTEADTLGIPEFGTDFVKKNFLKALKPTKFSHLVQISGFSHGTNVWTQNQQSYWKEGELSLEELIACREDIWTFLENQGLEKKNAFLASEYIRKGNWNKLHETIKQKIRVALGLTEENINKELAKIEILQKKVIENNSLTINEAEKEIDYLQKLISYRRESIEKIEKELTVNPAKKEILPRNWKKQIQTSTKGEKYYNILSKIQYIFPKPHAISYTITAWRTAYYKTYFPQQFYSVLLTYHATVYDIWLMTFDSQAITFRLEGLLKTLNTAKNSEKELLSIIKVLEQLNKDKNEVLKKLLTEKGTEQKTQHLENIKVEEILTNLKNILLGGLENKEEKELNSIIRILQYLKVPEKTLKTQIEQLTLKEEMKTKLLKEASKKNGFQGWKLTVKERELLFTLNVILEIELKGYIFPRGIDFNNSEVKNFKIENNKILIPFTAVTGIGEKVAEKIIAYRLEKGKIANWKEEISTLLNKNHLEQIEHLEKFHLIIED